MADLAASDVSVAIGQGDIDQMHFNKVVFATLSFGDGALTYPTGGIPLPTIGYFDLYHAIRFAPPVFSGGYLFVVDIANHKLYIWDLAGGAEYSGAPAATEVTLKLEGQ